ncbi:hypothetical protein MKZ02_17905 [Pseudobacillus sp. FSL P4-0506]|uniref:COG4315 family predicted lipoprotein n=1 Tax=Pseudobacillus sp. FSL P4-0506 TaxID=2921576 RepID=UPI0030FC8EAB
MNKKRWLLCIFSALVVLSACGKAENPSESATVKDAPVKEAPELRLLEDQSVGEYLADSKGITLYYFKKDKEGTSNCSGECLKKWPPFTEKEFEVPTGYKKEDFGSITREDDGQEQVTYKGYPLYYFAGDKQEGDRKGQGVKGVWYIVNKNINFQ